MRDIKYLIQSCENLEKEKFVKKLTLNLNLNKVLVEKGFGENLRVRNGELRRSCWRIEKMELEKMDEGGEFFIFV